MSSASDNGSAFSCNIAASDIHLATSQSIINISASTGAINAQDTNNNNNNGDNNNTRKSRSKKSVNNEEEETIALFNEEEKCHFNETNASMSSSSYDMKRKLSSRKSFTLTTDFTLGKAIFGEIDKAKRSIDLIWRNVHYCVESTSLLSTLNPFRVVNKKHILNGLTGSISTGEITAVIGPSGAGKSSFLEILAGRREKGFTGDLVIRFTHHASTATPAGEEISTSPCIPESRDTYRRSTSHEVYTNGISKMKSSSSSNSDNMIKIAFMGQKDIFSPNLTVKETLVYASRLKNYNSQQLYYQQFRKLKKIDTDIASMSHRIKSEIDNFHYNLAAEIMEELSLLTCAHVKVGKCSGGQQKRLSIACELVSHPDILILDEPTSGLGESICLHLL